MNEVQASENSTQTTLTADRLGTEISNASIRYRALLEQSRTAYGGNAETHAAMLRELENAIELLNAMRQRLQAQNDALREANAQAEKQRVLALGKRVEEERTARIEAEHAARRLRLLAEASRQLAAESEVEAMCTAITRTLTRFLVDHCEILLLDRNRLVSTARSDREPPRAAFSDAVRKRHNLLAGERASLLWSAVHSGLPQLAPPPDDTIPHSQRDVFAVVRASGRRNAVVLPLIAGGRTFGVIVALSTSSTPQLGVEDLGILIELGARVSLAISHQRLIEDLARANREKADFLAVLSHELRTPLAAVIGYADLMLSNIPDPLPQRYRDHVQRIRSCSWHQIGVVDQILSYARVENGIEEIALADVDVPAVVAEVTQMLESGSNVRLVLDVPATPLVLRSDAGRLRQILTNLLTNAFKFTGEGAVTVSVRRDDDHVFFTVADTGEGIGPADLAHVFDPFWRAERHGKSPRTGMGLGLAVCQRLARTLGGELNVRSELNTGTTFTLRLPMR